MSNLNLNDDEIKRLNDEGFSSKQIAVIMQCSKTTILNHLRKIKTQEEQIILNNELYKNDSHKRKGIPLEEIIKLYNLGYTDKEIATTLGCSRSNITTRLNKAGIKNRKSKKDNIKLCNKISNSLRGTSLGVKNANYKGKSDVYNLSYYYKNRARGIYRTLAKEIIRNNPKVCSICGIKTSVVEVHHIRPFKNILNEFLTNVFDGNPDTFSSQLQNYYPFMDINNLIIVCPTCHSKIHRKDNPELSHYLVEK